MELRDAASVPSGASTGIHEALELRDGDLKRFKGNGVLININIINSIIFDALAGIDVSNQRKIDNCF